MTIYDYPPLTHPAWQAVLTVSYRKVQLGDDQDPIDDWIIHISNRSEKRMAVKRTAPDAVNQARAFLKELLGAPDQMAENIAYNMVRSLAGEYGMMSHQRPVIHVTDKDYRTYGYRTGRAFGADEIYHLQNHGKPAEPVFPDMRPQEHGALDTEQEEEDELNWQEWLVEKGIEEWPR